MALGDRLDRFQRRHGWLGFPVAVLYKCLDDRATYLAANVTYYVLVSLFPLSLLFVSAAGFFLEGHPEVRSKLITSAAQLLPGIGTQIRKVLTGFKGNAVALAVGAAGTLYGGLGATTSAQCAFNQVYGVPRFEQPNPIVTRVRGLGLLVLIGLFILASTGLGVAAATTNELSARYGPLPRAGVYVVTFVMDVALFSGAFQLLTAADLRFRNVLAGGVIAAGTWELLQTLGARYIAHLIAHDTAVYGAFGVVVGTIVWIYLEALALMIAAEVNVVHERRLWPRALWGQYVDGVDFTDGDRRCYRLYLEAWRFKGSQRVDMEGPPPRQPGARSPTRTGKDGPTRRRRLRRRRRPHLTSLGDRPEGGPAGRG